MPILKYLLSIEIKILNKTGLKKVKRVANLVLKITEFCVKLKGIIAIKDIIQII